MKVNSLLVRYADGYRTRDDDTAVAADGVIEGFVNYPEDTSAEADRKADGTLSKLKDARWSSLVRIEPTGSGDTPFEDFSVGDTITVPDQDGNAAAVRVLGLTLTEDSEGNVVYEPEVGSYIPGLDERFSTVNRSMSSGTLGGRDPQAMPLRPGSGSKPAQVETSSGTNTALVLPVASGAAPDFTGTGNDAATPERIVSSAAQTSNAPKVTYVQLRFDQSTDEHWTWSFMLSDSYDHGGTLVLSWGAKVTSGDVVWKAAAAPLTTTTDYDAAAYNAVVVAAPATVPSVAGRTTETRISLDMTGARANGMVNVFVGRDADHGSDDAAGDATLVGVTFEWN